MKDKKKQKNKASFWEKFRLSYFYMLLGVGVAVHISLLICIPEDIPSISKLDASIPFQLLMFGLVMASFVPMLVYSYTINLLKAAKEAIDEGLPDNKELSGNVVKFRNTIDFIVNESMILITISILVGSFVFIETNIRHSTITLWFLKGYYVWYLLTAIVWSMSQFLWTKSGRKMKKELGKWSFCWYIVGIYSWVGIYIAISFFLLKTYWLNYPCPNCVIWLKYLIIVTSLWLLSFSVLWIIPSEQYYPLWKLKESYLNKYPRKSNSEKV